MIAGGGTGGHIYPAIAIAQEFIARSPRREAVFVGTEYGLEKTIVPKAGFPLEFISVGGLKGKSIGQTVKNLFRLPMGFLSSWALISRHRPAAIVGVGGYASGPVLLAGAIRRVPTLIHESNAYPGLTNRLLARVVTEVAVGFSAALPRLKRKGTVTGNPIRREFFDIPKVNREPATVNREGGRLLVFGGSQGSRILNETMVAALPRLAGIPGLEIVHQTGPAHHEKIAGLYAGSALPRARVVPYLDRMWEEFAAADLVVSRAGAMTVGELCAAGRASLLVPFALATNNHQEENARVVERAGGAVVITEAELTRDRLADAIASVLGDPGRVARMGEAARALAVPDASARIVKIIERIQKK
jgi:UDP-N-acetylglucosamine--N-acetylmuramyl-(pentapeptide) pyrophosphoryl-undecaprenol N-acetylglucosamine transferase